MTKKYLTGRVERTPQTDLTDDRYEYLGLEQAEPNLGDPSVIPQTLPVGQQYQVISVLGSPGNRFWIPVGGGLIPGAITVFDEGVIVPTNAGVSSITQVNFVGAAISAKGYVYADGSPGIGVTITVFAPGNNQQLLFNNNNEFGTSSLLTFDNVTGILTAGKALNVGIGGTVITATSLGLVGIGTTNPTQELDVNGDIRIRGTIYDYNNQPGVNQQVLLKNNFGGLSWNNQSSIRAGAGGTYTQVQYHNASGLVDGATGFVYDPNTNKVGIGSTSPRYILDVIGTVNISGLATITNLYVSGIGTFNDIVYVISTEQSTSTSTGALVVSGGVGIAKNLNVGGVAGISSLNVTNHTTSGSLYVSGISTLGVTTATNLTAQTLRVSGISTLGVTTATDLTAQSLVVSGVSTLGVISTTNLTSQTLNVSGISTLGVTTATNLTAQTLRVSGISTLGVTSTTNLTSQTLNVSGISTLGVTSATNLTSQTLRVSGISTLGVTTATDLTAQSLVVSDISTFYGNILPGSNGFYDIGNVLYKFNEVYADTFIGQIIGNADTATVATNVNGGTGNLTALNVSGISTLGVTTTTDLTAQSLVVSGTGTITNLTGTNLNITGISTFQGNVTLGDANTDKVSFGATVDSNIIPSGSRNLGSVANPWSNVYATTITGTIAGNADTATKLLNARTIAITGDLAYTSPAFDGTGNVTAAGTLATVNSNVGTFGSSTFVPQITVNAKGLVTGISSVGVNFSAATVAQADKLTTARTIAITGDLAYTSPAFDGTGNVTAAGTLAATTVVAGSYGSGSQVATFTVDAKGRLTAASNTSITGINASSVAAAGADTQVQFNDGGAFAGDADFTFAKTTNTVTTRFLALNGNGSTTSAQLAFNGGTNNWITFGTTGVAAPAFTTRSVGTKIVLYGGIGASSADYGFGIESSTLWSSVPTTSNQFKWYGGTTLAATLSGAGAFTATRLISTVATGTAPFTVSSTTEVANLRAATVTTNANLTGHVTSVGNAAVLGSFTSAQLATALTDETGSGANVFATSPTLVTPALGTPSSGTLTNCTGLPISTGVSGLAANVATFLATPSSANLATAITNETGSGSLVFATSPTLVTPALGTPSSGTLTSCTGLPISTGVSGLAANVATFLATPSSANLATAITNETGSGSLVFATSPTLVTPALGTPSSGTLTSCTGLPISGLTASTTTALGVGSINLGHATDTTIARSAAGTVQIEGVTVATASNTLTLTNKTLTSPTLTTPALGTPSSGNLANCTFPTLNQNTTGNANTATTATTATYLNTANSSSISDNITNRINSGFWETSTATTGEGWPTTTNNFYHLISSTHSNTTNYYALQLAAPFFTQNLYYRSTGGSGSTAWKQVDAFASGTTIVFYQASAPTGWTKSTSHNNKALRVVSGTGGGSGGSTAFTSVFASRGVPLPEHNHTASCDTHGGHQHSGPTNNQNTNHTHTFTTGNQNADHGHSFTTNSVGDHNHLINAYITSNEAAGYGMNFAGGFENRVLVTANNGQGTTYNGGHNHTGATAGQSANHQHGGTTAGISNNHYHDFQTQTGGEHGHSLTINNNGTASASMDFAVQYIDVIICSKN